MNIRVFLSLCLFSLSIAFVYPTFAAGSIPRDGLRLELILATGAQDTSGNKRPVTATGIAPSYQVDSVYGVPYAQFSGSGGLRVNTAWSAGASDDFTLSMWTKNPKSSFSYTGWYNYDSIGNQLYWDWWYWTYRNATVYLPQPIFINASGSINQNSLRLLLLPNGKCSLRGVGTNIDQANGYYSYTPKGYATMYSNYFYQDFGNNMIEQFDCSKLVDEKWHNIVLLKKSGTLVLLIDGSETFKVVGNFEMGRDILLGFSNHFSSENYLNSGFSSEQIGAVKNAHFSRSAVAGFRLYNRALTNDEIEALGDEYRYAQSDLIGAGNITIAIEKYTKPNVMIQLKSIAPNLSKDTVEYQYSTDGKTFSGITDITDISSLTGSLDYKISLNISSVPDGKVNITLRVKSGETYQNIGSVSLTKLDTVMSIIINQPNTETTTSKNISATTDVGNTLYMFQTRGTTCDSTITTWEDYSDLIFTSKNDNGIRVCYKAINPVTNKTIYKLSTTIQGIQSTEDQKAKGFGLFENYALWTKSTYQKPDDSTAMVLDLLGVSAGQSQGTINGITMTDINGDGLVDFLYSRNDPVRRAILINNGNYTFKTVYKCAIDVEMTITWPHQPTGRTFYYGDCADTTR